MPSPFAPRPAQILTVPDYLTFGLYVLAETWGFDEIAMHKLLLDNIAGAKSSERGKYNRWKTDSRLRFEVVPAQPIVAMYESFMPFFGISDEYQARLHQTKYLISLVVEQDLSKEGAYSALRILEVASALTAIRYDGLILDPLAYKVFDCQSDSCKQMLDAFDTTEPLTPLLSITQIDAEQADAVGPPLATVASNGLCRFGLPEIIIDRIPTTLAGQVKQLVSDISYALLEAMRVAALAGQRQISLEAPLVVRDKAVLLRLQHGTIGLSLNLNLHGRLGEREDGLRAML